MNPFSHKVEPTDIMSIQIPRVEVENWDINPTLRQLNRLKTDKVSAQKYGHSLSFEINGYEDSPKSLMEIRDVQKFMEKLDKEFPYWFYFLRNSDPSLEFILFSVCPHYKESSSGKWRVQRERFSKFMAEHHAALDEMFDLAEIKEEEREMMREEINTFFGNVTHLWYDPNEI